MNLLPSAAILSATACLWAASPGLRLPEAGAVHRIRLSVAYKASGQVAGAFVSARINGSSRTLRLLVDTGASNIVLDSRAARRAGIRNDRNTANGSELRISGFGGGDRTAYSAVAQELEVSGVEFRNVPVQVIEGPALLPEGDGLIGLDVFADYRVEWNVPQREIRLSQPDRDGAPEAGGVRLRKVGHLLFVMTTCNGRMTGYGLVDTGAAYSAVARESARQVNGPGSADRVAVQGVMGNLDNAVRMSPVRFDLGDARLLDREPLAVDLAPLSAANGLRVAAVIGYPALQHSTLTVDYRAGTLRISGRQ